MTPNERFVSRDQIIFVMDERVLVAIQRSGKAAAFDTLTGRLLWSERTGVGRVYDAQLLHGVLAVAGDEEISSTGGRVIDLKGVIQLIDPLSGARTHRLTSLAAAGGAHPRWIRLVDSASLIVGLENAVSRIDLGTGAVLWSAANPDAMPSTTAWLFPPALIIQGADRSLWRIDPAQGAIAPEPLEGPRTHLEGVRPIALRPVGTRPDDGFAVCTFQGLMIYAPDGDLKGVDALGGFETIIPPRLAQARALTIETVSQGGAPDGLMNYNLYAMDTLGARIIESTPISLGARPHSLALLDGKIALSAGQVTLVIQAPTQK